MPNPPPFPINRAEQASGPFMGVGDRLTVIETKIPFLMDEMDQISKQVSGLDAKIDAMNDKLTTIIAQRDHAEKSLGRWKNAAIGVMTGLFIGLVGWIAKIALVVQAARITN